MTVTRAERRGRRRRWWALGGGILAFALLATGVTVVLSRSDQAAPATLSLWRLPSWVTSSTTLANLSGPTAGYDSPGGDNPVATVQPKWGGAPVAFPVEASVPGWYQLHLVALPGTRSEVWVRADAVTLTRTPYRIVVDTAHTRVLVFEHGAIDFCAPAAIGTGDDPTPPGHYFAVLFAQPPSAKYGAFVIVTSAFTDSVTDWQQSGHPTITFEGPLDSAATIGTTGVRATTGAVRLLEADLERLRELPSGTPIDVVATLELRRDVRSGSHHRVEQGDAVPRLCGTQPLSLAGGVR